MALPTYKTRGIQYANLPSVDTTSLKVGAQMMESLNRKLDMVTKWADTQGTKYAQEQAKKFALENPVTQEEVEAGAYQDEDANSFLSAVTGGNVYRDTLRATQGALLSNQLSLDAAKEIEVIEQNARNGLITYDQAKLQMNDLIDGFAGTVGALDTNASIKARAQMTTTAKTSLTQLAEFEAKTMRANVMFQLSEEKNLLTRRLESSFVLGDTFDPETQTTVEAGVRNNALVTEFQMKATALNSVDDIENLPELVSTAKVNGVTRAVLDLKFAGSYTESIDLLESGELPPSHKAIWDQMGIEDQDKVIDKVRSEIAAKKKLEKEALEIDKEQLMLDGYEKIDMFFVEPDPTVRTSIRKDLEAINAKLGTKFVSDSLIAKMRKNELDIDEADDETMARLERMIDTREEVNGAPISREYLLQQANDNIISFNQLRTLQNRYKSTENANLRNEIKIVRGVVSGLVDEGLITRKQAPAVIAQAISGTIEQFNAGEQVLGLGRQAGNTIREEAITEAKQTNLKLIADGLMIELQSEYPDADWAAIARDIAKDQRVLDDYLDPNNPDYDNARETIKMLLGAWD